MYFTTNQFPLLPFFGPHKKPHGVRGLGKHYHMRFDPKIGNYTCEIRHIPYACNQYKSSLKKTCNQGMPPHQQPRYQTIKYCTYWTALKYFNNCNIIQFSPKATYSEDLYKIYQVVLDKISDNMAALVQNGHYGDINTTYTTTKGYYVIKFLSEYYTLQEYTHCDVQIVTAGEPVVKLQYTNCMQENTKWY